MPSSLLFHMWVIHGETEVELKAYLPSQQGFASHSGTGRRR